MKSVIAKSSDETVYLSRLIQFFTVQGNYIIHLVDVLPGFTMETIPVTSYTVSCTLSACLKGTTLSIDLSQEGGKKILTPSVPWLTDILVSNVKCVSIGQ